MNTKLLMTASSLVLGLAGIFALFAPENLLAMLNGPIVTPLSVLIQLMGALYFSLALMNWTAKDSAIGGIYARPVSLGNFAHFFIGSKKQPNGAVLHFRMCDEKIGCIHDLGYAGFVVAAQQCGAAGGD